MTVTQIQLLLTYLGYTPGAVDGIAGEKTRTAVRAFQQAAGISVDGVAGKQTCQALKEAIFQDRFRKSGEEEGDFWKDIRYFSRRDPYIGCSCGACGGFPAETAEKLMRLADRVREQAGVPMIPPSGAGPRTERWPWCGSKRK